MLVKIIRLQNIQTNVLCWYIIVAAELLMEHTGSIVGAMNNSVIIYVKRHWYTKNYEDHVEWGKWDRAVCQSDLCETHFEPIHELIFVTFGYKSCLNVRLTVDWLIFYMYKKYLYFHCIWNEILQYLLHFQPI